MALHASCETRSPIDNLPSLLVCISGISASQKGHDRVVEKLLQAGATVDLQNKVVKLSLFVHLSLHEKVREHIQHIATGGMHGTTN